MTEHDELKELWTSQPIQEWKGRKVPRFALLDDEVTAVASPPLSTWNKVAYAYWPTYMAIFVFRDTGGHPTVLAVVAMAVFVLSGVGTALYLILHRDKSRAPRPDESVAEYRAACLHELERQFGLERRAMIFALSGFATAATIFTVGAVADRALSPLALIWLAGFVLLAIAVFHSRRGYWTRSVNRLRRDVEDVQ